MPKAYAGTSSRSAPAKESPSEKRVSTGRDRYMKHHRGCSGAAYIHLKNPQDAARVREILSGVKGVERVLTRDDAAREFKLMASRIGHLVVLGDKDTVFGELDDEKESFPGLRSHGSTHELDYSTLRLQRQKRPV